MSGQDYGKSIFRLLLFISLITVFAVMKITADLLVPVIISLLASFIFYPLIKKLNAIRVPWVAGILVSLLIAGVIFFGVSSLLLSSIKAVVASSAKYEKRFFELYVKAASTLNIPFDSDSSLFENILATAGIKEFLQDTIVSVGSSMFSFIKVFLMISLMAVFLLLELNGISAKIIEAFSSEKGMSEKVITIVKKIMKQITNYLSIKFTMSLLTGILVFICSVIFSIEFPVIWGFLAFVLNFIPNFGSIVSWAATSLFAFMQFYPSWTTAAAASALILAVNVILGSFVEPRCTGGGLGLSPFIILASLSLWGWMWGFTGMILAVPLMVIIKIIFENIEELKPFAVLMGSPVKPLRQPLRRKSAHKDSVDPQE